MSAQCPACYGELSPDGLCYDADHNESGRCVHGLFAPWCSFCDAPQKQNTQSADHISLLRQRNAELLAQRESDREQIAKLSRLVATQLEEIRLLRTRVLSYSVAQS